MKPVMTETRQPAARPTNPSTAWRRGLLVALILGAVGVVALTYLFWEPLLASTKSCARFLGNKEELKTWIRSFGSWAPIVFILTQSLQVVFAPIPGEVTGFLGGYLFGVLPGFIFSSVGLTLGSIAAFLLGRWLEIHFVEKVVSRDALDKFDFLMEREGTLIAFLLFLFPGFPKDYLCFILGLSQLPLRLFVILVTIGRLPGTLMLSLQGAHVFAGNYHSFFIMLGIFIILAVLTLVYREKFYRWLRRLSRPAHTS